MGSLRLRPSLSCMRRVPVDQIPPSAMWRSRFRFDMFENYRDVRSEHAERLSDGGASPATVHVHLPVSMLSTIIVVASWSVQRNLTVYGTTTVALFSLTISILCGLAPANAFLPRFFFFFKTYFSKSPFAATGTASSCQRRLTPLLTPSICKQPTEEVTLISKNSCTAEQKKVCPMSGVEATLTSRCAWDSDQNNSDPKPSGTQTQEKILCFRTAEVMTGNDSPGWRLFH